MGGFGREGGMKLAELSEGVEPGHYVQRGDVNQISEQRRQGSPKLARFMARARETLRYLK